MAQSTIRVEIGAWVEGTVAKRDGKGMRKVWVAPTPKGEDARLSVIATRDGRDTHVITLRVGTPEEQAQAAEAIGQAAQALIALQAQAPAAPAKAPARKAPTPPPAPKAPEAVAANRAVAIANARAATTRNPAPAKAAPVQGNWFADLLAQAGA